MNILLKLISICRNSKEYENIELHPLLQEILQQHKEESNKNIEKPLVILYKLLYKPPSNFPPTITTTAGVISPLGPYRLKCIQFIIYLLRCNYQMVDVALVESKIISRCIDLFFQFKWNNILHSLIEVMIIYILENKPTFLSLYILRDCNFLYRILQAQQHEDQEKELKLQKQKNIPITGYMGHLYNISNAIINISKINSTIFYFIQDIPNRSSWIKFIEGKLKPINILNEKNKIPTSLRKTSIQRISVD